MGTSKCDHLLISFRYRIDVFQSHSDRFLKALVICQRSAKNDLKDLDISKSLNWDDVMAEYQNAYWKYESKARGVKGLSRKFGRITGDNAPSVIPFLNFIPEGQYKTLFAGLVLIFGVNVLSPICIDLVPNRKSGCRSDEQQETINTEDL